MKKIALLVENMYEDLELHYPFLRLKEARFQPIWWAQIEGLSIPVRMPIPWSGILPHSR